MTLSTRRCAYPYTEASYAQHSANFLFMRLIPEFVRGLHSIKSRWIKNFSFIPFLIALQWFNHEDILWYWKRRLDFINNRRLKAKASIEVGMAKDNHYSFFLCLCYF